MNLKLFDEKQLDESRATNTTGKSLERCNASLISLKSPSWPLDIIEGLDGNGIAKIHSVFTGDLLHCVGSFAKVDFNCLLFTDEKLGEKLVLVQHCCNTIIASLNMSLFIPLSDVHHWVNLSIRLVEDSTHEFEMVFNRSNGNPAIFGGLNLSQGRPYHYFYDYLYGLDLVTARLLETRLPVYAVTARGFVDPSLIYEQVSYLELNESDINKMTTFKKIYLIAPCIQHFRDKRDPGLLSISTKLNKVARAAYFDECTDQITGRPILWIGISTEKRSWIEQVDGYSAIINKLSGEFPGLQVIVDGRTFPTKASPADWHAKAKEDKIFDDISSRCSGIRFVNLIGASAIKKLAFCTSITTFIAHIATDSMFPSALSRKPGVIYSPNCMGSWGARQLHIHHNVVEVDSSAVSDVTAEGAAIDWATTSVSMKWESIYKLLTPILRQNL